MDNCLSSVFLFPELFSQMLTVSDGGWYLFCIQCYCEPTVTAILSFSSLDCLLISLMAFFPVDSITVLKTRAEFCR